MWNKIKSYLVGIGIFIVGFILAMLGFQKKKIDSLEKQVDELDGENESLRETARKQADVIGEHAKATEKVSEIHKTATTVETQYAEQIKEAEQDAEHPVESLVDVGNNLVDMFNSMSDESRR